MKKTKRIFAIFMSLAMILTMSIAMSATAFAADPAYDSKVSVTDLTKGDVANFYQVVEWVGSADGNVGGWKAVAPFDTYLTKDMLTQILKGIKDDPATTDVDETVDPGITSDIAGELAKLVASTTAKTEVTVGDDKKAELTIPADKEGLYMVLITPADADTVYNPVFVAADYNKTNGTDTWKITEQPTYSDTAAAKKNTVGLTKTPSTAEDAWDEKATTDNQFTWTTTAIGDTVDFTVNTTIPGYGEVYDTPFFKVSDKLTALKLVKDSVKVTAPSTLEDTDYEIVEAADGLSYTVEFKADYLKTVKEPTAVTITYKAIVTTDAPLNINREKNEVSTEFSNNPNKQSDHGFKKDVTNHYTFSFDVEGMGTGGASSGKKTSEIVKIGVKPDGTPITQTVENSEITSTETWKSPLADAEFKLYTDANCTNEYVPKKADGTTGTPLEIKTLADGRMAIKGLDAGTYYLREEVAPAGFIKDNDAHKIEIKTKTKKVNVTEYTQDGATWISAEAYAAVTDATEKAKYKAYTYETEVLEKYEVLIDGISTATYNFTNKGPDAEVDWTTVPPVEKPFPITNTQGTELPSTGGIGTIIFYTLGSLLVIGCGIVLISRRRLQKNR